METREIADGDDANLIQLWKACSLIRPWNDPQSDLELLRRSPGGTVMIGELHGSMVASAMTGFDGHRGWIYYLAVRPDLQGNGYGRKIVEAAEEWLLDKGCPKAELIIRGDNLKVLDLYRAFGYHREDRALMAKWLKRPPQLSHDSGPPRVFDVTVSYLEMKEPPKRAPIAAPQTAHPLSLQRLHQPSVSFYRYLQHTVGDPWLWWERCAKSDAELQAIIQDDAVELYVLSQGGVPAGFVELDFRDMPNSADVAYFGLMPEFIGRGLGPYLLNWGIDCAWNRTPAPIKLQVNTCTLDHPAALRGYQKAGFEIVERETIQVEDPVALGYIARDVKILSPGY